MEQERHYQSRDGGAVWVMVALMLVATVALIIFMFPDILPSRMTDPVPGGAVGNQAPPAAVRRAPPARQSAPAPSVQQGIDQYNAAQQAQFDAAVQAAPAPAALPLNSAGEPVISEAQAQQMQQSLLLAEQEGAAAADAQLQAQRDAAYAEQAGRAPDVSKEEAEKMMGRDLCHVPRADPHTCEQGLYKPTPVN